MLVPVLQLESSYLRIKTSPDTLWSSNYMEKLQIAEGVASQSLEEEGRSVYLSRLLRAALHPRAPV